ncbi:hypothetical protein GBA52_018476 [Prunus armeniaca]|nr:hypothetical protein GBA52_018476 [Prunus armeniaca]
MEASEVPVATVTQRSQKSLESQVGRIYESFAKLPPDAQFRMLELKRENHIDYLKGGLRQLPSSFCGFRPWVCFWNLHSLALLGESVEAQLQNNIIDFLSRCQDPNGGYGGGPGQARFMMVEKLMSGPAMLQFLCQTYEGGISAEPGTEAHGGYVSDFYLFEHH